MACKATKSTPATPVAALLTDEQSARKFANAVAETLDADEIAVGLVDVGRGRWQVTVYFGAPPDLRMLRELAVAAARPQAGTALRFSRVAAEDWVGASLAALNPVSAGRFIIHGAHDRARIAVNRIGIEIEAALAFGTGHHGTTRGCLLALDRLCRSLNKRRADVYSHPEVAAKRPSKDGGRGAGAVALRGSLRSHLRVTGPRVLDLGTGSGVLAIAAARALRRRVLATDIDPAAVRAARDNARLNRAMVEVWQASGLTAPAIRARAPFDLVFANILLAPLQRLAVPLTEIIAPGGRAVLSGLLASQANAARAAYHGLRLERRITLDGWTTLVLRRASAC
jgi:ribosomal protein L11 methyltransferase